MRDQFHLLKTRRFLPLFITQFLGAFNDNAFKNALVIWYTYDMAQKFGMDAFLMVNIAGGLLILPFFLFSALAGQFADKYEKSFLAQKIKQVEIILMGAAGLCFYFESVIGLLIVLFFMGAQSTFFGPIKYSLLPEHLRDDELIGGNGLVEGGTFLSILLGTIFGGLIIRTQYGIELLSCFVILFAVTGWAASRYIPQSIHDARLAINWNIFTETCHLIRYAMHNKRVWWAIMSISWFWLLGMVFLTNFPVFTQNILSGNEHIVTLCLTVFSVGIGIGSLLCNRLLRGNISARLVPWGAAGMSIATFMLIGASIYYQNSALPLLGEMQEIGLHTFFSFGASWLVMFSLLLLAMSGGIYIVPLYTIMQHDTESGHVARIIASNNIINSFFMVVAVIIVMGLFQLGLTILDIFAFIGVLNLIVIFGVRRLI